MSDSDNPGYVGFFQAAPMPIPRSDMTVTLFPSETFADNLGPRIYLTGGCIGGNFCSYKNESVPTLGWNCYCDEITSSIMYFTPKDGKWKSNLPNAPTARYRHMAARVDNLLYILGGRSLYDDLILTVDIFNTLTNSWLTPLQWTKAVSDGTAFNVDSKIYLVGGYEQNYNQSSIATDSRGSDALVSFDTITKSWDYTLPRMPTGRGDVGGEKLGDRFYVLGGWDYYFLHAKSTVESYHIPTKTWRKETDMLFGRSDMATAVMGDKLFAIAGETTNGTFDPSLSLSTPVPHSSRFTTASNKWIVEANIPASRFRFLGAAYNSTSDPASRAIYLFGGQQAYNPVCGCYRASNKTIKYVPKSIIYYSSSSKAPVLDDAGIAGVVIAAIVVAGAICVVVLMLIARKTVFRT
eukprot:gene13639-28960_t